MALSEFERRRFENIIAAYRDEIRPPARIRKEIDFGYRIENQSVLFFEIRPAWQTPNEFVEIPTFKATYVKSSDEWKLYWMRASGRWELYEPDAYAGSLEEVIGIVKDDQYGCFFG